MNAKVLIDNIVRQTTVLIAQLATAAGLRAPLAHIANSVFLNLVGELESQGVGRKVIADMFGLALRSYQLKVRRLSESATERNRSLWEAVFEFLRDRDIVNRAEVLRRFRHDDDATVRGVLHDLVETGLVFKSGHGNATVYRVASDEELGHVTSDESGAAAAFVWVIVYRYGPVTRGDLQARLRLSSGSLDEALEKLVSEGRIERDASDDPDQTVSYRAESCVIPVGSSAGWEAALFDHYQAMVNAIGIKLQQGATGSLPSDVVGGSTYSFDVWDDHPHAGRVLGLLRRIRDDVSAVRAEVTAFNQANGRPRSGVRKVTFYLGQSVRDEFTTPAEGE